MTNGADDFANDYFLCRQSLSFEWLLLRRVAYYSKPLEYFVSKLKARGLRQIFEMRWPQFRQAETLLARAHATFFQLTQPSFS